MTDTVDYAHWSRRTGEGVCEIDLAIDGIDCAACLDEIEGTLKPLRGVERARLNLTSRRLTLAWREAETSPDLLIDELARIGYGAFPFEVERAEASEAAHMKWLLKCLAVAGFASMNIMLLSVSVWSGHGADMDGPTRDFFHWMSALIALPAAAYAGQPFFRNALAGLRARSLNMDVPISLGILLALGMSIYETMHHAEHAYFDSAVMLLLFLLLGRVSDQMMRRKTRAAAANLSALKGERATRLAQDGSLVVVPVGALRNGDRVLVRSGERVPADARIVSGRSEVDESVITGETMRRTVQEGAALFAGSINFDGVLTLEVTAAGQSSLLDEVGRLVEKASEARSGYRRLADRAARIYAPMVHVTAFSTLAGWLMYGASLHDAIITAIAVLIITCPCALALAVPAVQVVASGSLFRAGVYLNSAEALERLAEADWVVFDKSGTLTLPTPGVVNAAFLPDGALELASRLALASHHPLAGAVARAGGARTPFDLAEEVPGAGVKAQADGAELRLGSAAFCGWTGDADSQTPGTSVLFFRNGRDVFKLEIRQALRVDAVETVAALKKLGLGVSILSGDLPSAVAPVAATLGVADWKGGLKPADKIAALEALKARGRKVLMVGDGLNDAPALAAAHASLSPISAVDLAQAQSDAVFLGDRLQPVVEAVGTSRMARALMRQNLWLAVLYNAIAVPMAVMGFVTPLIAAAAMSGSSVLVTLNALRCRRAANEAEPDATTQPLPANRLALAGKG